MFELYLVIRQIIPKYILIFNFLIRQMIKHKVNDDNNKRTDEVGTN
jgi:hypothetical protein